MKKVILAVLFLTFATLGFAQQTVLNVPSVDVLDKGKAFVRFDVTHYPALNGTTFTPNFVYGIGNNIEIGLNADALSDPTSFSSTSFVPNVKWRYDGLIRSGEGIALTVGTRLYLPVHNRSYRVGNFLYGTATLVVDDGLRLGAGFFNSQNVVGPGNRGGALLTFEKVINDRATLAADWQSGHGSNGFLTGGVMFFPTKRIMIIPAYQVGNGSAGRNHGFTAFLGFKLN